MHKACIHCVACDNCDSGFFCTAYDRPLETDEVELCGPDSACGEFDTEPIED